MDGDIVAEIQDYEAPWRTTLIFLNKGKSLASTHVDVQGSSEINKDQLMYDIEEEYDNSTSNVSFKDHQQALISRLPNPSMSNVSVTYEIVYGTSLVHSSNMS